MPINTALLAATSGLPRQPMVCVAIKNFTTFTGKAARGEGSANVLAYVDSGDRFSCELLSPKMLALMVERGEVEFARRTA